MSRDFIGELLRTVRAGANELVRQNALDLLYKLAGDGVRAAKLAIEAMERTNRIQAGNTGR